MKWGREWGQGSAVRLASALERHSFHYFIFVCAGARFAGGGPAMDHLQFCFGGEEKAFDWRRSFLLRQPGCAWLVYELICSKRAGGRQGVFEILWRYIFLILDLVKKQCKNLIMLPMRRFCSFAIGLGFITSVCATQYEVSGFLEVTHPLRPDFLQEFGFRVSVADHSWNIHMTPRIYKPLGNITPDYWEAGSDGTNWFALTSIQSYTRQTRPKPGHVTPSAFAYQGLGTVPFGFDRFISGLWFTYASQDYLKHRTNWRVVPPEVVAGGVLMTNDFTVPAYWQLDTSPPFFAEIFGHYQLFLSRYNDGA